MEGKIITIQTPKKFLLSGMFFGARKPENIFVYIHGLGGTLFSQERLMEKIISKDTAVLAFNNRGSGIITRVRQLSRKEKKGYISHTMGMAHEVFTDCVDDIEGAVQCAKSFGAKNIFLMGHSTGCQKSVYYLSRKSKTPIKGVVLLAPMSDYADVAAFTEKRVYDKAVSFSGKLVEEGRQHDLLPENIWPMTVDAQRFLSLHTPDSTEEIFSYATGKKSQRLHKIKLPILIVLAEDDDFKDRPMSQIADWFENNTDQENCEIKIIEKAQHHFTDHIDLLVKIIKAWKKKVQKI